MNTRYFLRLIIGTALLLLVPLIAMQFSDQVQWNLFDFIVMAILLIGTGVIYGLITSRLHNRYRGVVAVVLFVALLLVWAELAVGLVGSPIAGS